MIKITIVLIEISSHGGFVYVWRLALLFYGTTGLESDIHDQIMALDTQSSGVKSRRIHDLASNWPS